MITVVTGAPCSGKSTFVNQNARTGDCIIDMDRIALALTTSDVRPYEYNEKLRKVAQSARQAAVKTAMMLAQGERYWGLWIIHTDPEPDIRAMYRSLGARLVEMQVSKNVCLERLKERPEINQKLSRELIETYYAKRNQ